ncbi:MAG: hypothetical protein ACJAXT_001005 [Paracoccaceae bacterium]|jgi:uncharacterized protein (DUF952 family)
MLIYKILRADEWADLQAIGQTAGAPIDVADGYIHFSTAEQAAETAAKHFTDVEGLELLAYNIEILGQDLEWEASRGDDLFPHLYAPLRRSQMSWHVPLPLVDGVHQFPADL